MLGLHLWKRYCELRCMSRLRSEVNRPGAFSTSLCPAIFLGSITCLQKKSSSFPNFRRRTSKGLCLYVAGVWAILSNGPYKEGVHGHVQKFLYLDLSDNSKRRILTTLGGGASECILLMLMSFPACASATNFSATNKPACGQTTISLGISTGNANCNNKDVGH